MKKLALAFSLSLAALAAGAQAIITDTVSAGAATGAGVTYPNQVWYSLAAGEQGQADRTEWDIAFELKSIVSGVQINSPAGVMLWKYPNGNLGTAWTSVDTTGLSNWTPRYNSDTNWSLGAIGAYADPANANNLDWGNYNSTTHVITGDAIYIIKLPGGAYKKFAIETLISGVYTFKYADIDGSNAQSNTIAKSNYTDKNFAYYNLSTNKILDREPKAASWDLLFTQYTTNIGIWYGVTGVLQNRGVQAVRVSKLTDVATNVDYASQTFNSAINTIGYNWKDHVGGGVYKTKDSVLYFVRTVTGEIWKMVFTGFGGAVNGNSVFTKQKLFPTAPTTGIGQAAAPFGVVIYPNPASGSDVQLIADLTGNTAAVRVDVYDMSGRTVRRLNTGRLDGLQRIVVPAAELAPGSYILRMSSSLGVSSQRLTIR